MRAIIPDRWDILRASLSARKRGRFFFLFFFFMQLQATENHPVYRTHLSLLISMQNKTSVFRYVSSAFISAMFYGVSLITSLFSCSSTSNDESGDVVRFGDISTKVLRMISLFPCTSVITMHFMYFHSHCILQHTFTIIHICLSALDLKFISSVRMTTLKTNFFAKFTAYVKIYKTSEYISSVCISATFYNIAHYIFCNNSLTNSKHFRNTCCESIKNDYFYI